MDGVGCIIVSALASPGLPPLDHENEHEGNKNHYKSNGLGRMGREVLSDRRNHGLLSSVITDHAELGGAERVRISCHGAVRVCLDQEPEHKTVSQNVQDKRSHEYCTFESSHRILSSKECVPGLITSASSRGPDDTHSMILGRCVFNSQ